MITERRIKDLSFALEALSRVNSYSARAMVSELESILEAEIEVAKKQQAEREEVKDLFVARDACEAAKSLDNKIPF